MVKINLSIDVPEIESGINFYSKVFGFPEISRPFKTMAILKAENLIICIHEKSEGTNPSGFTDEQRRYSRHWTPVHIDFHVEDFDNTLNLVEHNEGKIENIFDIPDKSKVAFCSDPFGNGFCIIEKTY